mgnify:CR=1 FL=1
MDTRDDARVGFRAGAAGDSLALMPGRCCRSRSSARTVFAILAIIFAVIGSPFITAAVRAIVLSPERALDARGRRVSWCEPRAASSSATCCPRRAGFLFDRRSTMLVRVHRCRARRCPTWAWDSRRSRAGARCLQDASSIGAFADFPWLLSPAAPAMF